MSDKPHILNWPQKVLVFLVILFVCFIGLAHIFRMVVDKSIETATYKEPASPGWDEFINKMRASDVPPFEELMVDIGSTQIADVIYATFKLRAYKDSDAVVAAVPQLIVNLGDMRNMNAGWEYGWLTNSRDTLHYYVNEVAEETLTELGSKAVPELIRFVKQPYPGKFDKGSNRYLAVQTAYDILFASGDTGFYEEFVTALEDPLNGRSNDRLSERFIRKINPVIYSKFTPSQQIRCQKALRQYADDNLHKPHVRDIASQVLAQIESVPDINK